MTILLLPPSESKESASGRAKLKFNTLAFPELSTIRADVLDELIRVCNGSAKTARTILEVSEKQQWEIVRNQNLKKAAVAPAWQIYTGVLYDAVGFSTLTKAQQTKLGEMTFVQSALFGLISLVDQIPAYRLSGDCILPKLGSLPSIWSSACTQVLASTDDFIIDLRSGMYQKLGPLPSKSECVVPKILQRMPSGPPKVVSHFNKATKGRIVRAIAQSKTKVNTVEALANIATSLGAEVNVKSPKGSSGTTALEVIVGEL